MLNYPEPLDTARETALQLYERCLAVHSPSLLETFIEQQLATTPLPLDFLYDLADDLQQRLLSLKESHFDVRKRVVEALVKVYHTDISHLTPISQPHRYHRLSLQKVMDAVHAQGFTLKNEERSILAEMVKSSTRICAELYQDIQITEQLYEMLDDWLFAYSLILIRELDATPAH